MSPRVADLLMHICPESTDTRRLTLLPGTCNGVLGPQPGGRLSARTADTERHLPAFGCSVQFVQGDQNFSVHLIITEYYLAQSDCLAADRQGQGDTRLTLTPSVILNLTT
jgi:hypothetical protein